MPSLNEIAPDFTLQRDGGEDITMSALRPAPVVLYFYPKDDTSGCTKEALAFSSLLPEFTAAGAIVFGISKDSVEKHAKFAKKYALTVGLLSDTEDVCEAYGVWKEKSMYGKTYMGIERSTFLIDGNGKISRAWNKVKVDGHAEEVLEAVKSL